LFCDLVPVWPDVVVVDAPLLAVHIPVGHGAWIWQRFQGQEFSKDGCEFYFGFHDDVHLVRIAGHRPGLPGMPGSYPSWGLMLLTWGYGCNGGFGGMEDGLRGLLEKTVSGLIAFFLYAYTHKKAPYP